MAYTIHKLATLAGVTVRTLHYYDAIGLLSPAHKRSNGYREYEEPELLKLQQIMFFRELDFPLEDIKKIIANPKFDLRIALKDHKELILIKRKRLDNLLKTIDITIKKINNKNNMKDHKLYDGFSTEESDAYAKEAKERWGNTKAYRESQERYGKLSKEDKARIQAENDSLLKELASTMDKDIKSPEVQILIDKHYNALRTFYEPNLKLYKGLADMYVEDERFTIHFEKYRKGFAKFMRDAMHEYCDQQK